MSGVVQHKSIISTAQNPTITLDSPVTEGNMLLVVIAADEANTLLSVEDGNVDSSPYTGNEYALDAESGAGVYIAYIYNATANQSGSLTLAANFASNDGSFKHIHLFEVAGYITFDKQNSGFQATENPSVAINFNTTEPNEFVFAVFMDITHTGVTFMAGSGYTAGELTNANGFSLFTEYATISSVGQPSASASISDTDSVASLIATFYGTDNSGGGSGDDSDGDLSSFPFLGSVVEDTSDALPGEVFLGTVKILDSPPDGSDYPFLGSVKIRNSGTGYSGTSPHGGPHYPWIGQVVIVESGPNGENSPSLGLVDTQ